MAFGLPVISTSVPGVDEFLEENKNGFLVESNIQSISSAFSSMAEMSESDYLSMSDRARETAKTFDIENTVRKYIKDYEEGGIEKLKEINFYRPESKLLKHKETLEKYFEENTKYKINLISIEHSNEANAWTFFKDKPYVEIVNPYLNFIKASDIGTIRLDIIDNNFYTAAGDKYEGDTTDIRNIMWEHYYVHVDFLKENVHLKDYIIYNANHQSNQVFN
jgi:hypothetical protein